MLRGSITEHDAEVVSQHQILCGDCNGLAATTEGVRRCGCHGTGRVGNCSHCGGLGHVGSRDSSASPIHSGCSCFRCGGKGWVGNCAPCRGLGILESGDGYVVCAACSAHGHLYQNLYKDDPVHAVAIVRVADAGHFFVPLGEAPVLFGRFAPPYSSVRLTDALITKRHFEIYWHPTAMTHEVRDHGRYSLRLNGEFLAGAHDRVRLHGSTPGKSDRRLLVDRDMLQIGQYLIEYTALLSGSKRPAG